MRPPRPQGRSSRIEGAERIGLDGEAGDRDWRRRHAGDRARLRGAVAARRVAGAAHAAVCHLARARGGNRARKRRSHRRRADHAALRHRGCEVVISATTRVLCDEAARAVVWICMRWIPN
eukprot:5601851-Prymnesium_polylepis.2